MRRSRSNPRRSGTCVVARMSKKAVKREAAQGGEAPPHSQGDRASEPAHVPPAAAGDGLAQIYKRRKFFQFSSEQLPRVCFCVWRLGDGELVSCDEGERAKSARVNPVQRDTQESRHKLTRASQRVKKYISLSQRKR